MFFFFKFPHVCKSAYIRVRRSNPASKGQTAEQNFGPRNEASFSFVCYTQPSLYKLYHYSEATLPISKTSSLNITDISLDGIQTFNTQFSVMLKYIYIPESIEKTFYTIRRLVLKNFDTTFHLRRKEKVNICFLI